MPAQARTPLWRKLASLRQLFSGGEWSTQVTAATRRSLRWFIADGVAANISDTILLTYQSLYLMALGATRAQIGTLGAFSNLMLAAAMLPAAVLAQRGTSYKGKVVIPALLGRLFILPLIFLPFLSLRWSLIELGIALIILRVFLMNLLQPAWTALVAKIVPIQWRGRYFSTRNIIMGLAGVITLTLVGRLIDAIGKPQGYQVALGIALVAGLASTYAFSRIEEPPHAPMAQRHQASQAFWKALLHDWRFWALTGTAMLWQFSVQIGGPFFTIFLMDGAGFSAAAIGAISAAGSLMAIPGQRLFGWLTDTQGSVKVQRTLSFVIPVIPLIWGFMRHPWQGMLIESLSGFLWAGYNLAAFNLLLEMTPDEHRPSYVAVYQTALGLGMAAGAALGGWIAQRYGYLPVFLASASGRWVTAVLFSLTVARAVQPRLRLPRLTFPRRLRRPAVAKSSRKGG